MSSHPRVAAAAKSNQGPVQKVVAVLEKTLSYQYAPAYVHVLAILSSAFRAFGRLSHPLLDRVLSSAANLYGVCVCLCVCVCNACL